MQHSIKQIAHQYSRISEKRNDKNKFIYEDFLKFASDNMNKYKLIKTDDDFLVSTWYSGDMIDDYIKTLKKIC